MSKFIEILSGTVCLALIFWMIAAFFHVVAGS